MPPVTELSTAELYSVLAEVEGRQSISLSSATPVEQLDVLEAAAAPFKAELQRRGLRVQ